MTMTTKPDLENAEQGNAPRRPLSLLTRGLLAAAVVAGLLGLRPLLAWQRTGQEQAVSLTNLRRLAVGLQQYAQDWDGRAMAPALRMPDGQWRTWVDPMRAYVSRTAFNNPANRVPPSESPVRHPTDGYTIYTSYALNRRFWNTFGPGSFPLENLELPGQTVLFVEAGPMWRSPRAASPAAPPIAYLDYGDTTDRYRNLYPYPAPHNGRMAVVAADGHGVVVTVEHYAPGAHDTQYGRLGGSLYNWNGGHPNQETDRPAHE